MTGIVDVEAMLRVAVEEARTGLREGGIPIGAALFTRDGKLLGAGHNRRVQENDPSVHAETNAFRKAGRQRTYKDKVMVTTLAPCWYCSGLIRQFGIGAVVVGESNTFGVFQGSCRVGSVFYAASFCCSSSLSGLSITAPMGSQFLVLPDQRSGCRARASWYSACRRASMS